MDVYQGVRALRERNNQECWGLLDTGSQHTPGDPERDHDPQQPVRAGT